MTYTQFICDTSGDALDVSNVATSGVRTPAEWLINALGGGQNVAGISVNGYTALTHPAIWQGVNIIAGDFGQTPVKLLRNEYDEQKKHPAWSLLRVQPNDMQAPSVFKETMMQWTLIWGNAVAYIVREAGVPVALIPLRPDCVWPETVVAGGTKHLLYHYTSIETGRHYVFFSYEVIHTQGLTGDGLWGYPLWQVGKNTIGYGLALQKHGCTTFANGAVPSGVLEAPSGAVGISKNKEARKNLRDEWNAVHRGPDKAGAVAILWEGITYKQTSNSNQDAQWIEATEAEVYQAARLLNLPPHKLGALQDSSVRANIEEQNADYVLRSLSRWYNRYDEEYRRKLLTTKEHMSGEYQFKHDSAAFLRGDIDTISTVADRLVKAELANRNEGRAMLGMPPYEGGDRFGSPAINPQPGGKPRYQNDPNTPQKSPRAANEAQNAHRDLLLDRLMHFIDRENHNLTRASSNAKNFLEWLDDFYVGRDGNDPTIVALVESIMGSSIRASCSAGLDARGIAASIANYAKKRHSQLLEACSLVTKGELPATIEKFTNSAGDMIAQGILATSLAGLMCEQTELLQLQQEG